MSGRVAIGIGGARRLVHRERVLPYEGELFVAYGSSVGPDDIIGRCPVPSQPFALPAAAMLDEHASTFAAYLTKRAGDKVVAGETIAAKKGFLGREKAACRSPKAGTVTAVLETAGQVIITPTPKQVEVRAGLVGTVVGLLAGRAIVLEVAGLYAQGLCLAGDETWGPLQAGAEDPAREVEVGDDHSGCVVFGGHAGQESLSRAAARKVRALVVGSVSAAAWTDLTAGRFPGLTVLVTEAIGAAPMSDRTFEGLMEACGSSTFVSAGPTHWQPQVRPEVIVCTGGTGYPELALPRPEPGAEVRITAGPFVGRWGRLAKMGNKLYDFPTGYVGEAAEVILTNGERAVLPLANLELVG